MVFCKFFFNYKINILHTINISTHSLVAEWSVAIALTRVQIPVCAFFYFFNKYLKNLI